jgi:hypothetical protein
VNQWLPLYQMAVALTATFFREIAVKMTAHTLKSNGGNNEF